MPSLIYRADVENDANKGTKIYFGLAETSFKCGLQITKILTMNHTKKHRTVKIYMIV